MTSNNPQGPDVSATPQTPRAPGDDSRLRWVVAAVLSVIFVVCLVLVVLEVTTLRPKADDDAANQDARSQAISAAERFTVQFNTYDSADLPAYQKSLKSMMSPKFRASFDKAIAQVAASIKQGKVKSKGVVLKSAVATPGRRLGAGARGLRRQRSHHLRPERRTALPLGDLAGEDQRPLAGRQLRAGALMSTQNPRSQGSRRRIAGERRPGRQQPAAAAPPARRRRRGRPVPPRPGPASRPRPRRRRRRASRGDAAGVPRGAGSLSSGWSPWCWWR